MWKGASRVRASRTERARLDVNGMKRDDDYNQDGAAIVLLGTDGESKVPVTGGGGHFQPFTSHAVADR